MLSEGELGLLAAECRAKGMTDQTMLGKLFTEHAAFKAVAEHCAQHLAYPGSHPTLCTLLTAAGLLPKKATIAGLLEALGADWRGQFEVGAQKDGLYYMTRKTDTELAYARGTRMVVASEVSEGLWVRFFSGEHVTKTTHTEVTLAARDIKSFLGGT